MEIATRLVTIEHSVGQILRDHDCRAAAIRTGSPTLGYFYVVLYVYRIGTWQRLANLQLEAEVKPMVMVSEATS